MADADGVPRGTGPPLRCRAAPRGVRLCPADRLAARLTRCRRASRAWVAFSLTTPTGAMSPSAEGLFPVIEGQAGLAADDDLLARAAASHAVRGRRRDRTLAAAAETSRGPIPALRRTPIARSGDRRECGGGAQAQHPEEPPIPAVAVSTTSRRGARSTTARSKAAPDVSWSVPPQTREVEAAGSSRRRKSTPARSPPFRGPSPRQDPLHGSAAAAAARKTAVITWSTDCAAPNAARAARRAPRAIQRARSGAVSAEPVDDGPTRDLTRSLPEDGGIGEGHQHDEPPAQSAGLDQELGQRAEPRRGRAARGAAGPGEWRRRPRACPLPPPQRRSCRGCGERRPPRRRRHGQGDRARLLRALHHADGR